MPSLTAEDFTGRLKLRISSFGVILVCSFVARAATKWLGKAALLLKVFEKAGRAVLLWMALTRPAYLLSPATM